MNRDERKRTLVELVAPGLAAGWAAGIVVLLIAMAHSAAVGLGPLWPLETAVDGVFSERNDNGVLAALLGLVVYFTVTGASGILFNSVTPRGVSYAWASGYGLVFAVLLFVLVRWLILPLWAPAMFHGVQPGVLLAYHLLFGLVVPLAIPMRRNVTRTATDEHSGP